MDFVLNKFEAFCEPICNFRIACLKFSKVQQYQGESIDVFYNSYTQGLPSNVNSVILMRG